MSESFQSPEAPVPESIYEADIEKLLTAAQRLEQFPQINAVVINEENIEFVRSHELGPVFLEKLSGAKGSVSAESPESKLEAGGYLEMLVSEAKKYSAGVEVLDTFGSQHKSGNDERREIHEVTNVLSDEEIAAIEYRTQFNQAFSRDSYEYLLLSGSRMRFTAMNQALGTPCFIVQNAIEQAGLQMDPDIMPLYIHLRDRPTQKVDENTTEEEKKIVSAQTIHFFDELLHITVEPE